MESIKLTGRTFPLGTPPAFPVKNKIQIEIRRKEKLLQSKRRRARLQALKL
tara:strand:+ start:458 stop:610 length:153 start_codon:yes stop_codon:yes gene_type:complete